jgi:branched-subunit amino acid permease
MRAIYLRSLLRMNLSISLLYFGLFMLIAVLIPVMFWLYPWVAELMVGPIPLAWLVLVVVAYPVLVAFGAGYVRSIEEAEAEYSELVDEP